MAYRSRGRSTGRSYSSRSRTPARRGYGAARGRRATTARRSSARRSSPNELRIVIESTGASPVSRYPGIASKLNPPAKRAKL